MTELMGHVIYFWVLFTAPSTAKGRQCLIEWLIDELIFLQEVRNALSHLFTHLSSTNILSHDVGLVSRITKMN